MLFYRFLSENLTGYINSQERTAGSADFDYAQLSDAEAERARDFVVSTKGSFILPFELFANVRKQAAGDQDLNEHLERIFKNIEGSAVEASSEKDIQGLFDDLDVNSAKLGNIMASCNAKLVKILDKIGSLLLDDFNEHEIDFFGDAYEFLMTIYASKAEKSGGEEFFTPQEVPDLLARLTLVGKERVNGVRDPACGSDSLLLRFAKILGQDNIDRGFFGQEINLTTYNLARINMFLHRVGFENFDIALGNTLTEPAHWDDEPFEAIVSNPPYSRKWEGSDSQVLMNDERFAPAGVLAPKSKADPAFTMHILHWLSVDGGAVIVEFPGVLYRGGAEQKIRRYLIDHNYVDTVIQLPADLFFGTSIGTCIIVLKKSKADNSVLFIDTAAEFERKGTKNHLTEANKEKVLAAFSARADAQYFARLVPTEEIVANDYNLSVSSYVEPEDTREVINIKELNARIAQIVTRQSELRAQIDVIVADLESDDGAEITALSERIIRRSPHV